MRLNLICWLGCLLLLFEKILCEEWWWCWRLTLWVMMDLWSAEGSYIYVYCKQCSMKRLPQNLFKSSPWSVNCRKVSIAAGMWIMIIYHLEESTGELYSNTCLNIYLNPFDKPVAMWINSFLHRNSHLIASCLLWLNGSQCKFTVFRLVTTDKA